MEDESLLKDLKLSFTDWLQQPDLQDVVQHMKKSSSELISSDEESEIEAQSTVSGKLTRILEIATRHGQSGISELHRAFCETKNAHLAERIQYYIRNKTIVWPPRDGELIEMLHRHITLCSPDSVRVFESYRDDDKVYRMRNKNRGLAIIINNECFETPGLSFRVGSDKDQNAMKQVLQQLHFTVQSYTDLTVKEMLQTAQVGSQNKIHETADCFVFVVLSHGDDDGIYGVDGRTVTVEDLSKPFYSFKCKELENKPKIFIFQACRGSNEETSAPVSKKTAESSQEHYQSDSIETYKVSLEAGAKNPKERAEFSQQNYFGQSVLETIEDSLEDVEANEETGAPVSKKTAGQALGFSQPEYFEEFLLDALDNPMEDIDEKTSKNNKEEVLMSMERQDPLNKEDENLLKYYAAQVNRGISLTEDDEGLELVSEDVDRASLRTEGGDTGRIDTDGISVDDPTDISVRSQEETLLEYYRAQERRGIPFTAVSAEAYSFTDLDEKPDQEGGDTGRLDKDGISVNDPMDMSVRSQEETLLEYYRAQEDRRIPFTSVSAKAYSFSELDENPDQEREEKSETSDEDDFPYNNEYPYVDSHMSDISMKINEAFRSDSGAKQGMGATTRVHHMAFSKADFVFAYATAEGYKTYRNAESGSWFIQALVWLLKNESHREHFIDILTQVNDLVSKGRAKKAGHPSGKKSVSEFETSLRKKLYFFPGLHGFPPKRIEGLPDDDSTEYV